MMISEGKIITDKIGLEVKILKIEPESKYQGKEFGRFLTVELANGSQILIWDNYKKTNIHWVQKKVSVKVNVHATDPIKKHSKDVYIRPFRINNKVEISGIIEEIIVPEDLIIANNRRYCVINVGLGKVLFDINRDSFSLFEKGDSLSTIGITSLLDIILQ